MHYQLLGLLAISYSLPKDKITKGYEYLWKGKIEIIYRHLFRDVITDSIAHSALDFLMTNPQLDSYFSATSTSSKKTRTRTEAINNVFSYPVNTKKAKQYNFNDESLNINDVFCVPIDTRKNSRNKVKPKCVSFSCGHDHTTTKAKTEASPLTSIISEVIYHGKFKLVATLTFPIVYSIKESANHLWGHHFSTQHPLTKSISLANDLFTQTTEYLAINPDELMFLTDSTINLFYQNNNVVTGYVTQTEVETRRTSKEFSDFMNEYNSYMETVDAIGHSMDYYRVIGANYNNIPNLPYKLFAWGIALATLKYNTDIKQPELHAKFTAAEPEEMTYIPEEASLVGDLNLSIE